MEGLPPVKAKVIIEMLGSPKEHLMKTLQDYINALKERKDLTVLSQDIAEAAERDKLFSTFTELEINFKSVEKLLDFCFESMPSSVEIIEPDELILHAGAFSDLLNDLQARLHQVDMSMKQLSAQSAIIDKNAMGVLHNFIKFLTKEGGKTSEELAPTVGIKKAQLEVFLESMVEMGHMTLRDGKYTATNK
ncbi:MAG: hypothetical protein AABY13_02535 [Nanoarchaeota archaeon]